MKERLVTRRAFLGKVITLSVGSAVVSLGRPWQVLAQDPAASLFNFIKDPDNPSPLEKEHMIDFRLPKIAEDGANVPVEVSMNHPMEPDHYIKSFQILIFDDPIVSKGVYHFTPANGQAYIYTQIRMDGGDKEVYVIAECSKHGKWVGKGTLKVSLGGC